MGLQEEFEVYAERAKTLPLDTPDEPLRIIFGLYKQATVGDINISRPGALDMKGKVKWDAWKVQEGKSKDQAMSEYIAKVKQLLQEAAANIR